MTPADRKEIALILREFRVRRGLSQTDLAARCGAYAGTLIRWETGGPLPNARAMRAFERILEDELDPGRAARRKTTARFLRRATLSQVAA